MNRLNEFRDLAWQSILDNEEHMFPILKRLDIYECLIDNRDVFKLDKSGNEDYRTINSFPNNYYHSKGGKKYVVLNLFTISKMGQELAPLIPNYKKDIPLVNEVLYLIDLQMNASIQILNGNARYDDRGHQLIEAEDLNQPTNWHYVIGNLVEEIPYKLECMLLATYRFYNSLNGQLPIAPRIIASLSSDHNESSLRDSDFIYDISHFASEMISLDFSSDYLPSRYEVNESGPRIFRPEKRREFWHWWLFEGLHNAYDFNLSQVGWPAPQKVTTLN